MAYYRQSGRRGCSNGDRIVTSTIPLTWDRVDEALEHELKTQRCLMRLRTSSRRLFAFVAIYSFLHDYMTRRLSSDSEEWCSFATSRSLLRGVAGVIKILEGRVRHYEKKMENLATKSIEKRYISEIDYRFIFSRQEEVTDPDKKIWKRLYAAGVVPDRVIEEYEKVKNLLPDEAIANHEFRKGKVTLSDVEETRLRQFSSKNSVGDKMTRERASSSCKLHELMTPDEFYSKYVRSDIAVARSNDISELFSENFEILPCTNIRVPRRIERYLNAEIANAANKNSRYPSNYIRGMIIAYYVGGIFGGAFSAAQLYLSGFARSASSACGSRVLDTSLSRLKISLKSRRLLSVDTDPQKHIIFPDSLATINVRDVRKTVYESARKVPDRKEKAAVAAMSSTVAEHEADGYAALWLSSAVSRVLKRAVSPQYSLLFLVNWTARRYQEQQQQLQQQGAMAGKADEHLKRFSESIGLFFDPKNNMVLPSVGFGSGLTNSKLKRYVAFATDGVVQMLLRAGKRVKEEKEEEKKEDELERGKLSLEELCARLFKNNDILKSSSSGEEELDLTSIEKEEFVPNENRRLICEEEYAKALNPRLKLRFRFGVCGYQHPMSVSSDKQTLVSLQLLKHRQMYVQRERAAAINWERLLQFFFPRRTVLSKPEKSGPHTNFVVSRLAGLSRAFVEVASETLRKSLSCERLLDDICIKFNADILPLGKKPDTFLRTKAGLVVGEHARQALEKANHLMARFEECKRVSLLHPSEISSYSPAGKFAVELARDCVAAREHQKLYNECKSFIPAPNEKFEPIPLFGVENPIFPPRNSYVDNTATKCNDAKSEFWLEETNENLIDALVSMGILSMPFLSKKRNRDILTSNSCVDFYKKVRDMNYRKISSEKPRKRDSTPWSTKNTGQTGRNTTEFSPNSVIVLTCDNGIYDDYYDEDDEEDDDDDEEEEEEKEKEDLVGENGEKEKKKITYVEELVIGNCGDAFFVGGIGDIFLAAVETQRMMAQNDIIYPKKSNISGKSMILAPDISPVYRHGGKPAVITLKHKLTL